LFESPIGGAHELSIFGLAEAHDFTLKRAAREFFDRHAKIHALDTYTHKITSASFTVQPHAIVALLAVAVVVERAGSTRLRKADSPDLLEVDQPTIRQPIGRPAA
jgi:hypothetical protein